MLDAPKLSVVLATYNRAETLRQTLRHLADQELDPSCYEVIVIDDGSPDNTREVVEELKLSLPFALTYLHHANRGPGYTQNQGIKAARAPLILLMADDIFMSRQALKSHLEGHSIHPEQGAAILGQVTQSPALTESVFLRKWEPFRFADFRGLVEVPYYRFWACNISVKRDFLMQYGLFRETKGRAGPATHEDPELGYRLHQAGLRIYFDTRALGYHNHVVTRAQACTRAYQQGLNFDEFRALAPAPEIAVAYRDLRLSTLGDYLRTWRGPGKQYLSSGDRNPMVVLGRHALRGAVFNRLTVRLMWEPLFDLAERNPAVARRMRPAFYRGLIAFHFFRGCREGNARFGIPQVRPAAQELSN
jgi:glycosyltransferase involved in cell wall biosynthesis